MSVLISDILKYQSDIEEKFGAKSTPGYPKSATPNCLLQGTMVALKSKVGTSSTTQRTTR